jgi:hypothetical protein
MSIRRKPTGPFSYKLKDGSAQFVLSPPTQLAWAEVLDEAEGINGVMRLSVIRFVERLEEHEDGAAFGAAGSKERETYVDTCLSLEVMRELGEEIAGTLLSETDRGN